MPEVSSPAWQAAQGSPSHLFFFKSMLLFAQIRTCLTGKTTVNSRYGTKVAVLAGDFLFAQSSYYLAHLDNLEASFWLQEKMLRTPYQQLLSRGLYIL